MSIVVGTTSAQTPLQGNFGSLKSEVAGFVQGANIPAVLDEAGRNINRAIDKINSRNWNWLLKTQTITLSADTKTYTINADFKRPRKLERLDTSSNVVDWYDYQPPKDFLDTNWDDTVSGQPYYYTVRNVSDDRLLTFNVPPTSAFATSWPTARLHYFARCQHFADDGDTMGDLEIPPEVSNFLILYAQWRVAKIRGSASQARSSESDWKDEWFGLMRDDNNEQTDWVVKGRYI